VLDVFQPNENDSGLQRRWLSAGGRTPGGLGRDCRTLRAGARIAARADGIASLAGRFSKACRHSAIDRQRQLVTDKWEPNDIDCVLLRGPLFPLDESADADLWAGLPFIQLVLVGQKEFDLYVEKIYATDRHDKSKGMIEVIS
jgi:hypothetical protein